VQYGKYMGGVVQGDLGTSFNLNTPVSEELSERYATTLKLGAMALVFEAVIGILAGVLAGLRRGGFMDNLVLVSTLFVISIPLFVTGQVAQIYLGVRWDIFPVTVSYEARFSELLLPAMVLASTSLAYLARLTRTNLGDNLKSD